MRYDIKKVVTDVSLQCGPCHPITGDFLIDKEASTVRLPRLNYMNSQQAKALSTTPTPDLYRVRYPFSIPNRLSLPTPNIVSRTPYWRFCNKNFRLRELLALKLSDDCNNRISTLTFQKHRNLAFAVSVSVSLPCSMVCTVIHLWH